MKNPPTELKKAINRICPRIEKNLTAISKIIDNTPLMTDIHKSYMKHSLKLRYVLIIKPALKKYKVFCR